MVVLMYGRAGVVTTYKTEGTESVDHNIDRVPACFDITKELLLRYFGGIAGVPLVGITVDNGVTKPFPTLAGCTDDTNDITSKGNGVHPEGFDIFILVYYHGAVITSANPCGSDRTEVGLGVSLDGVGHTNVNYVRKAGYTALDRVELNFSLFEKFCKFTHGNDVVCSVVHSYVADLVDVR